MSDYSQITNFSTKDEYASGNPLKKIKGTEFDAEFGAISTAVATKANASNAVLTGAPTAPTVAVGTTSTAVATAAFVQAAIHAILPLGVILMWSGSIASIPSGWQLCNGANGSPNLMDRFVLGAGNAYAVGATGGANTVALTSAEMPVHNHTVTVSGTTSTTGAHTHTYQSGNNANVGAIGTNGLNAGGTLDDTSYVYNTSSEGNHSHSVSATGTTNTAGSGHGHENRPPYYALCYIMKAST